LGNINYFKPKVTAKVSRWVAEPQSF